MLQRDPSYIFSPFCSSSQVGTQPHFLGNRLTQSNPNQNPLSPRQEGTPTPLMLSRSGSTSVAPLPLLRGESSTFYLLPYVGMMADLSTLLECPTTTNEGMHSNGRAERNDVASTLVGFTEP